MSLINKPLRFGIIGLGFGANVHAPALFNFPEIEVVGIAGRSEKKASYIANKLGISNGFGSIDELLDLDLDAITIALPPKEVLNVIDKVLGKRLPLICEKPFGTDYLSSIKLLKKHNINFTNSMNFIFAELNVFLKLKEIIDSGMLGKIKSAEMIWLNESWSHRSKTWSWKTDSDQYGGVISIFGSHIFFFAEWLFGAVQTIKGESSNSNTIKFSPTESQAAEDYVNCTLSYSSGIKLTCSFGNANQDITLHRWIVKFERAIVVIENKSKNYTDFYMKIFHNNGHMQIIKEKKKNANSLLKLDDRVILFSKIVRRFVNSIRVGSMMKPDLHSGARVQQLDNALRDSIRLKKIIYL